MQMISGTRAVDKIYRRRDRYDIPDWQREEVWDDGKKRLLIDSMLRGWKLPKFYFLKVSDEPEEFEVVDGQQRLSTIFEFFDDQLELGKNSAAEFGGKCYSELPQAQQYSFDDFEIEYDIIEDAPEKEIKEFFQRLQAGLPLTSSEKLNAIHSNLRDYCKKLAKHNFFKSKVWLADTRYAHFDIASKVAAVEIEGLDGGLRYEDLKGTFDSQASFSPRSQVAKRLQAGFDYLDVAYPDKSPLLRHRTIIQSLTTLAIRLIAFGKSVGYEARYRDFCAAFISELSRQVELGANSTDQDYIVFQRTVNANVKSGARMRHEILLRKLLNHDPAVVDLLDPVAVSESGISGAISQSADSIVGAIHDVNEKYSAKHATNLFKPTNKSTKALAELREIVADYDGYKSFIDGLYFIFHEGAGTRLSASEKPQSLTDIPVLRTGIRHDVDHGSAGKVRKKVKDISATFKRYAGVPSPESLDPTRFPVVQANILAAIHRDLLTISP